MDWADLFDHDVLIVSGKGGTGKSTVASAIAVAASGRGRRTLLVEVEGRGEIARTLGVPDPGFHEEPTPAGPRAISISPQEAVREYLSIYAGGNRLARPLLRTGVVDQVISTAPGLRDLLICGKLYEIGHLRRTDARDSGRPLYELMVVDGPPTGQIAAFLSAPATFADLIRVGPLKRRASNTAEFLRRRARLVLVSLPEEMAVAETLEAIPAVASTGVRVALVILNRMVPSALSPESRRALRGIDAEGFAGITTEAGLALSRAEAARLLDEARDADIRHRAQLRFRDELSRAGRVVGLPEVPSGRSDVAFELAAAMGAGRSTATEGRIADAGSRTRRPEARPGGRRRRALKPEPSLEPHLADARIVVVCGSGGVGKTSVSAALAIHAAARGTRTMLLTVDPARRLATALRLPMVAGERTGVGVGSGRRLDAMQLDTQRTFDELIRRSAGSAERRERILSNPFYRRISDTLAGTHEYMAMEKLYELAEEEDHELIVVDTPPTRSALDFLDAPSRLTDFLGGRFLRWMLWPTARAGRFTLSAARLGAGAFLRTVGRLVGAEVLADTIDFLASFEGMYAGFKQRAGQVYELLRSPQCAFVVVTAPTSASLEEAGFFTDRLLSSRMRLAAVVVNRWHPESRPLGTAAPAVVERLASGDPQQRAAADVLSMRLRVEPSRAAEGMAMAWFVQGHPTTPILAIPELAGDVHDVAGLRRLAAHMFGNPRRSARG